MRFHRLLWSTQGEPFTLHWRRQISAVGAALFQAFLGAHPRHHFGDTPVTILVTGLNMATGLPIRVFLITFVIGLGMSGTSVLEAGWSPFWVHGGHRFGDQVVIFSTIFQIRLLQTMRPLPTPFSPSGMKVLGGMKKNNLSDPFWLE